MKSLIVYYSKKGENYFSGRIQSIEKGNTKVIAEKIAGLTNGELFELIPIVDYPNDYNQCTKIAQKELDSQARPSFVNNIINMNDYDVIYLGYPCWWGTYPRIVSTFLESYNLTGKIIKPFCTHEGSGMGVSEAELTKCLPDSIIKKGLSIVGSKVNDSNKLLQNWIEK